MRWIMRYQKTETSVRYMNVQYNLAEIISSAMFSLSARLVFCFSSVVFSILGSIMFW